MARLLAAALDAAEQSRFDTHMMGGFAVGAVGLAAGSYLLCSGLQPPDEALRVSVIPTVGELPVRLPVTVQ